MHSQRDPVVIKNHVIASGRWVRLRSEATSSPCKTRGCFVTRIRIPGAVPRNDTVFYVFAGPFAKDPART